jgi:hypothetical protein
MEDSTMIRLKAEKSDISWDEMAAHLPGRDPRQCRERWTNYLNSTVNRGPSTNAEDELLLSLHRQFGPKWALMRRLFQDRTDIFLKNRFQQLKRSNPSRISMNGEPAVSTDGGHATGTEHVNDDFEDFSPVHEWDDDADWLD